MDALILAISPVLIWLSDDGLRNPFAAGPLYSSPMITLAAIQNKRPAFHLNGPYHPFSQ